MKAIKLNKIQWNLNGLTDEQKAKAIETLPTFKGFMAQDDFNVVEKVPYLLKKNYGFDVITFSYTELRVVDTVEDLLLLGAPKGEKPKKIFLKNGELSAYGEDLVKTLESNIKWRLRLEFKGTAVSDMPALLDETLIGVEKVSGMNWEGHTVQELMSPIMNKIKFGHAANLVDKYAQT